MPSKYQRRSQRATNYSKNDLEIAVNKVKNKELTNYAAARLFGIPKSTLNDHVLGKRGIVSNTLGRPPAIPIADETRLANCLKTLEKWGFGLSKEEVLETVQKYVKENRIKTPFKNDLPGHDWFMAFKQRHNLSIKKPQPVEYARKKMTDPFIINEYFSLLKNTLKDLNINDPSQIWNLDETSVCLDPSKTKVVGAKGLPSSRTTHGTGKENITVLTTVNAEGKKLTPLIIFKGANVYEEWMAKENVEYDFELSYTSSKRGWMELEIFYNYVKNCLIPGLGEKRPVIVTYDGHTTHVNVRVLELFVENNVTVVKLPPHTSHLLQPLDLAVFKSFKSIWDKKLTVWQRHNTGVKLRKCAFSDMFAMSWHQTNADVIRNGFAKAGMYPFNQDVIPIDKYDPAAYRRWKIYHKNNDTTLIKLCLDTINKGLIKNSNPPKLQILDTKDTNPPKVQILDTKDTNPQKVQILDTSTISDLVEIKSNIKTFEELLLQEVKQHSRINNTGLRTKLTRVSKGAEVITKSSLEKMKNEEECKVKEKKSQKKDKKEKISTRVSVGSKPGTSGLQTSQPKKTITSGKTKAKWSVQKRNANTEDMDLDTQIVDSITRKVSLSKKKNKKKKSKFYIDSSDTDVSGTLSKHSDSDIEDWLEDSIFDEEENQKITPNNDTITSNHQVRKRKYEDMISSNKPERQIIEFKHSHDKENDDPIHIGEGDFNKGKSKGKGTGKRSKINIKTENLIYHEFESLDETEYKKSKTAGEIKKTENETTGEIEKTENDISYGISPYKIGESVIVRYYNRKWKYYIGLIEIISKSENQWLYTINFMKTFKTPTLRFTLPRKTDKDELTILSIVKKVNLDTDPKNPKDFLLSNEDDQIYFI